MFWALLLVVWSVASSTPGTIEFLENVVDDVFPGPGCLEESNKLPNLWVTQVHVTAHHSSLLLVRDVSGAHMRMVVGGTGHL